MESYGEDDSDSSRKKQSSGQVPGRTTRTIDVDKFDYGDAIEWLESNGIAEHVYGNLESFDELKELITAHLKISQLASSESCERIRSETTEIDVDKFDYGDATKWLESNGIAEHVYEDLESLDELKELITAHLKESQLASSESCERIRSETTESQRMMKDILRKDRAMKLELEEVYTDLENFLKYDISAQLTEVMSEVYPEFGETLKSYRSELVNDECPIVVAGETGAGKSSLLNLLIGTDVLPQSLLCTTSTICCLHNSNKKQIKVKKADGNVSTIELKDGEDSTAQLVVKLKEFVSVTENRQEQKYKKVDIFWPIPMLQDGVVIVDTPGVGESQEMTERLMEYLPSAVAFIYVINSGIAGGVQEDRLVRIIEEQKRWEREGKLFSFNYNCTLFVCNKWDIVEMTTEEDKVWKEIVAKLQAILPGFPEEQIFKMSTTDATRYVKSGIGHTDKFQKLLRGIEQMLPESLKWKFRRHYKWLKEFLRKLQGAISSRVNHARKTTQQKLTLHTEVHERLRKLKDESEKIKTKVISDANRGCTHLVDRLYEHLHSDEVVKRLKYWRDEDTPADKIADIEVIILEANKLISSRIKKEVKKWEIDKGLIKSISDQLMDTFSKECKLLDETCSQINMMIEGTSVNILECANSHTEDEDLEQLELTTMTTSGKVALAAMSPLIVSGIVAGLAIGIASAAIGLTIGLLYLPVMLIKENISLKKQLKHYRADKTGSMSNWTEQTIHTSLTKERIKNFIFNSYYKEFESKIDEVCQCVIPNQIKADERQIDEIKNDSRSAEEIISQFQPMQIKLKETLAKFNFHGLKYLADDFIDPSNLVIVREIDKCVFADNYVVNWKTRQIALKALRQPETVDEIYPQLAEVTYLRKLKSVHIVEFYGISYAVSCDSGGGGTDDNDEQIITGGLPGNRLLLLFELCDENLQNKIFNDPDLQCRRLENTSYQHPALKFYITMALGVCDGLSHIHSVNLVHRNVKLSNVWIKDKTVKLGNADFARRRNDPGDTVVTFLSHTSPELLKNERCTGKSDIFSFGILLWELWHGKYAFSEMEHRDSSPQKLIDAVLNGLRPKLTSDGVYENNMPPELKELVESCWMSEPTTRPAALEVGRNLSKLYEKYCEDSMIPWEHS